MLLELMPARSLLSRLNPSGANRAFRAYAYKSMYGATSSVREILESHVTGAHAAAESVGEILA